MTALAKLGALVIAVAVVTVTAVTPVAHASGNSARLAQAASRIRLNVKVEVAPRSASSVRTTVRISARGTYRGTTVPVRVWVGAKKKTARAVWKPGVRSYRATVRIATPKPAKVVVRTLGKRLVTTQPAQVRTRATGWRRVGAAKAGVPTRIRVPANQKSVSVTGKLTPAFGRAVLVQRHASGRWITAKTLITRDAAKVTITASLPVSSTPTRWRLRAPATRILAAKTLATTTVSTRASSTTPGSSPGPGVSIEWKPGQRNCRDTTYTVTWVGGVEKIKDGERIPGCTDFGPATIPAVSTVADHYWLDDRCAVTIVCWRKPTPLEISRGTAPGAAIEWFPPPTVNTSADANPEIAYVPETVDALNELAIEKGWITAVEIAQHGPPWREIKTPTWDQFPHSIAPGYGIVTGHGGPTQELAATRAVGRTKYGVDTLPRYSNTLPDGTTIFGFHSPPALIGSQMQARYPVAGYRWTCSEQGWTISHSVHGILRQLDHAHETGLRQQVLNYVARGYVGPAYITTGAYRWSTGTAWAWVNFCRLDEPDTINIFGSLPGDPWG